MHAKVSHANFFRFLLGDDRAVHEVNGVIGDASVAWVVSNHANRGAVGVQLAQQLALAAENAL